MEFFECFGTDTALMVGAGWRWRVQIEIKRWLATSVQDAQFQFCITGVRTPRLGEYAMLAQYQTDLG